MGLLKYIWFLVIAICSSTTTTASNRDTIDFFKEPFVFDKSHTPLIQIDGETNETSILKFYNTVNTNDYSLLINKLQTFKHNKQLSDWLYYQLVRRVAESISPKSDNYHRYTLYKWFLMNKSGYDARLAVGKGQVIFYIKNQEDIADIPFFVIDGQQFTCLNYHDYGKMFQQAGTYKPIHITIQGATHDFRYKIEQMPEFSPSTYIDKSLNFEYNNKVYNFNIKVSKDISKAFRNYPGVDFESYFNIPLTKTTYQSLIPVLKEYLKSMNTTNGVDYLMRFTRYAFLYENDNKNFGKEIRLSPEQTLLNEYSDCDDRVALFFYLVKEIYNLPMIAILYPTHINLGIQFEKKIGKSIKYEGKYYTICEPTPQSQNLAIGEVSDKLFNSDFKIVYHYSPK